jgi:hypothetical protein
MTRSRDEDRAIRPGWGAAATALLLAGALAGAGQALAQESPAPHEEPPQAQDGSEVVACLLPARITRYGEQLTVTGPRRQIETTRADCEERAGEVVSERVSDPEAAG